MEGVVGTDGVPLYGCPVAGVTRPSRCSYDAVAMAGRAIVVDNGSHTFRAGWAGEDAPSVMFGSAIAKPRPKQGVPRTVVGDWGPGLSGWDFGKHTHRYCFESDVPINMEGQEAMLDWALDRMGISGSYVSHPLLLTEAPLPPSGARSQLAQLVFEAYGVPALSFVAAASAAFFRHYNQHHLQQQGLGAAAGSELDQQQFCGSSSGMVICSGHSNTYVVPVYKGQPQWGASVRCWASGAAATGHLQQILSVKYPLHAAGLLGNWQLVEGIKEGFCCAAADYRETLKAVPAQPNTAGGLGVRVQLPFVETSQPSAADLAVKAQAARARGKALADMRRRKMLEEKEEQLALMQEVKAGVDDAAAEASGAGGQSVKQLLKQAHVGSREDLDKKITDLTAEVDRLRLQLGVPAPAPAVHMPATGDAMEVDAPQTPAEPDAAALAAAPVPIPAADSTATPTEPADAGNEADNEQDDNENDNEGDTDSSSTVTVSQNGTVGDTAGTAAAAAATAPPQVQLPGSEAASAQAEAAAAATAAAAQNEDSEATADEGNHSSSTVTDEAVFEQQGALQEVLQQVKQIRKKQRQEVKRKVQQQERQQRRQQERQQQQMEQQQLQMEINYLGIPDSMLTAEQIKIKRRQQSMHAARMARERAAARKLQQQLEREQRMAMEDEQFASDPFTYLSNLQQRHNSYNSRLEARKRKRLGQAPAAAGEDETGEGGIVGKRRRDEKHRQRMRLIAQAAAPKPEKKDKKDKKGKDKRDKRHGDKLTKRDRKGSSSLDEEGFGDEAADWEVYRVMDIRGSDSEAEAEEAAELAWTTQRLQQIGAAVAAAAAAAVTAQAGTDEAAAAMQEDPAAAAVGSSRAPSQEPPDPNAAAAAESNLLDMAAAAVAGHLVTTAYPGQAAAAAGSSAQQQPGLAGIDLNLLGLGGLGLGGEGQTQTQHLTAEDYQIFLGVERFRIPELLFQPMALAGVDQAGLPELVAVSMKRLPRHVADAVAEGGVVLTGGNMLFPGLVSRIESELRSIRPPDQPMKIYTTKDPLLDTWRGAAALAAATGRTGPAAAAAVGFSGSGIAEQFSFNDPFAAGNGALSRAMYEECGVDYLKEFKGFKYPDLPL